VTRRSLVIAALVLAGAVAGIVVALSLLAAPSWTLTGTVIDETGMPIAGASVVAEVSGTSVITDGDGRFALESSQPGTWLTATADGALPRTRAARSGHDMRIRLAPNRPGTVTLTFGGDVMFGRRYYDPNDDGDPADGLLAPGDGAEAHRRLLDGIAPLLHSGDLTAVNLESPLWDEPWFDPTGPRPEAFHPTKEFVFASAPVAAEALAEVGVDVVGLANNHLYDVLDAGVARTREALGDAGFAAGVGVFGGGSVSDEAWEPAIREVGGTSIGFVGCTSILGDEHPHSYVATRSKAGAAACEEERLRGAVRDLRGQVDIVIVMVHGGYEYEAAPSGQVRSLSRAASEEGATLVINHHPHVVGGVELDPFVAWTLGNLLFDQTVWPTFSSYVLQVAVHDGQVVNAWAEPIRHDGFLPVGVVGDDAEWAARGALARSIGPFTLDDGALWLDRGGHAMSTTVNADLPAKEAGLARLSGGCPEPSAGVTLGRDLLWTGGFEDQDIDGRVGGPAALWNVTEGSRDRVATRDAAWSGDHGVRLRRTAGNRQGILLSPRHRIPIESGDAVTVLLNHRQARGEAVASLQLSWYNDLDGGSQEQTFLPLNPSGEWRPTRLDVTVPDNAVAVGIFIELAPPALGIATLDVDEVSLIGWNDAGACEWLRADDPTTVDLTLHGFEQDVERVEIEPVAIPAEPVTPIPALPPRPDELAE